MVGENLLKFNFLLYLFLTLKVSFVTEVFIVKFYQLEKSNYVNLKLILGNFGLEYRELNYSVVYGGDPKSPLTVYVEITYYGCSTGST